MPTLYDYLGILVYFYSNDHEPIHVHGEYQGCESKAEIYIEDGRIVKIVFRDVADRKPLQSKKQKDFEHLVQTFCYDIVGKWNEFFVFGKKPKRTKITRRLL